MVFLARHAGQGWAGFSSVRFCLFVGLVPDRPTDRTERKRDSVAYFGRYINGGKRGR